MTCWLIQKMNSNFRDSRLFSPLCSLCSLWLTKFLSMKHHLDWSSYETAGQGDAYAGIPTSGGDFAKAVAVCISDKLCQRTPKGVMLPSFRATDDAAHSPGGRVVVLKAALNGELGDDPFANPRLAESHGSLRRLQRLQSASAQTSRHGRDQD